MLNKFVRNINHECDGLGGGEDDAAAAYAACMAAYTACMNAKQSHENTAATARANAESARTNAENFQTQINDLTSKQNQLNGIGEQYSAFQSSLNSAWTGYSDLNGYETLGQDMECIKNFSEGLGTMIQTLETEKTTWETYAQEQEELAEREQKLADDMSCQSC